MPDIRESLQTKRILVTGASGFIGSRLVRALLNYDAHVVALVDEHSSLTRLKSILHDPRLNLIHCNVSRNDFTGVSARWGHIDLIVHLGLRIPQVQNYLDTVTEDINLNLLPAIELFQSLPNCVEGICFASSVSVYGHPTTLPLKEDSIPLPDSSYGATKIAIENYLTAYGRIKSIPVTVLRYSTVYGPGELRHRAIPSFMHSIAEGQPPCIFGDGSEIRDYIYIDDAVEATILALVKKPSGVFLIGSGQSHNTNHVAREITRLWPADVKPRYLSCNNDKKDIVCDISAAREYLNFSPRTSLTDGLSEEISWYKRDILATVSNNTI